MANEIKKEENLIQTLNRIQKELKAPKSQVNNFGKYKYRSCEDILEAVKPLLGDKALTLRDEIVLIGDRHYVKATAGLSDGEKNIEVSAFARESLDKKGMDLAQITGATSSYARKYALNGLFCIDDTKDADTVNNQEIGSDKAAAPVKQVAKVDEGMQVFIGAVSRAKDKKILDGYVKKMAGSTKFTKEQKEQFSKVVADRIAELSKK